MEIFASYASLIGQLQGNLIDGTNKLSLQNSFLYEDLPRDLKHLKSCFPLFDIDDLEIVDCSN